MAGDQGAAAVIDADYLASGVGEPLLFVIMKDPLERLGVVVQLVAVDDLPFGAGTSAVVHVVDFPAKLPLGVREQLVTFPLSYFPT
jgi:hypothetical protein